MPGRRPKPSHIRILEGNPGKRGINHREPKPERGKPPCPKHLSERAQRAFRGFARHLDRVGVLTKADGTALELLATAYDDFHSARDIIRAHAAESGGAFLDGMTYSSTNEQTGQTIIRAHPAVGIADRQFAHTVAMLSHFGLTPATRSKVQ